MALPWLAVGKLVLSNLDTIIGVVKPGFTRKKVDTLPSQTDLLNQQIAELQAAASSNAEQIKQLAAQVKEVVAALAQAATEAAAQRAAAKRWSYVAVTVSVIAVLLSAGTFSHVETRESMRSVISICMAGAISMSPGCASTPGRPSRSRGEPADSAWRVGESDARKTVRSLPGMSIPRSHMRAQGKTKVQRRDAGCAFTLPLLERSALDIRQFRRR